LSHRERAARIGYVPQRPSLAFAFTVRQVVRLGLFASGRADGGAADAALRAVDLAGRADEPFGVLSVGQQQRATLARVLAQLHGRPGPIILADEPVSAMDPRHALETMTLLRSIAAAGGSVLVVLHDLTLALRWSDTALVLDSDGRLIADGPSAESLDPAVLEGVFGVRFERLGAALIPSLP
jgi:iron complex transport system ATP-binding protein